MGLTATYLDSYADHLVGSDAEYDEVVMPQVLPPQLLVLAAVDEEVAGCPAMGTGQSVLQVINARV